MLPWYKIDFRHENDYENAKYHLMWKINYFSLIAMFVIAVLTSLESIGDALIYAVALIVPLGNLLYMNKYKDYKKAIWIICCAGLVFPFVTLSTYHELMHIGDALWLVVAVCLSYYGLGVKIGRYFLFASIAILAIFIFFFLNINVEKLQPFGMVDKAAFFMELALSLLIIFTIITLFIRLGIQSEEKVKSINIQLEEKNKVVSAQNDEKEVLLKEIHHRVKNNLQIVSSLLSLQSNDAQDNVIQSILHEGKERIMTMALLHKMLYQSAHLNELNLLDYVEELVSNLKASFGKDCDFIFNIKSIVLDVDTTLSLGLIINELLTNSFKYGIVDKGEITITCIEKVQNHFELAISDKGPGLPEGVTLKNGTTLGLRLVGLLSRQLNGNCEYKYINGANFVINFTNTEERQKID